VHQDAAGLPTIGPAYRQCRQVSAAWREGRDRIAVEALHANSSNQHQGGARIKIQSSK
jgi:hypothetical protein